MAPAHPGGAIRDFDTGRLDVCGWSGSLGDPQRRAALIRELAPLLEPEVLKDLPPPMQTDNTPEARDAWIDARAGEADVRLVRSKETGDLIGLLILAAGDATGGVPTVHLGYLLAPSAWGRGFATELLAGLLGAAREAAPLRFLGGVARTNPASRRVLEKTGFSLAGSDPAGETELYELTLDAGAATGRNIAGNEQ